MFCSLFAPSAMAVLRIPWQFFQGCLGAPDNVRQHEYGKRQGTDEQTGPETVIKVVMQENSEAETEQADDNGRNAGQNVE